MEPPFYCDSWDLFRIDGIASTVRERVEGTLMLEITAWTSKEKVHGVITVSPRDTDAFCFRQASRLLNADGGPSGPTSRTRPASVKDITSPPDGEHVEPVASAIPNARRLAFNRASQTLPEAGVTIGVSRGVIESIVRTSDV